MNKEKQNHRQEYLRKMKENKMLLEQIDELKKQLRKAQEYKVPAHLQPKVPAHVSRKNSLVDR